jgi:hypothetical protein
MGITLYELYDGLKRVHVVDNVSSLFMGIYSGSIDAKSIKDKDLVWMRQKDGQLEMQVLQLSML